MYSILPIILIIQLYIIIIQNYYYYLNFVLLLKKINIFIIIINFCLNILKFEIKNFSFMESFFINCKFQRKLLNS